MSVTSVISSVLQPAIGVFGVAAKHLGSGETIFINEHEIFQSASVIKVPILVELFCRRDEDGISLDEKIELTQECKVDGSGVLKELQPGTKFSLFDLATLMIIQSDNTATNMIIDLLGPEPVTQRMRSLGLERTTLGRKMYDFEQAAKGKDNFCTPYEIMHLLEMLEKGEISSKSTSREMLEIMAKQQYRDKIPLLLPEDTKIANKTGSISDASHDAAVVYGPGGPYVLSIMAKGISSMVTADRAIADASQIVYEHYCG